ncbi:MULTISPECIES: trigger factor [unclassified Mogibacterium]|uniref:trigger factor n=1 Tax=unclassified Mogibacterium TaxID=2637482 RepID=UPI00027C5421|nr:MULTISPECIES: trigger factor [unclassified Mogibacterium]EJU20620.1 trigger factor [Mogibacterium sp. CM50]
MNTNLISKEDNIAKFTVVFTADEFEDAIVDAYKKNKDKFSIDGFRKGKAPRKIIESNYGNDIFYDEALNGLLNKAYPEAVVELDLEVVANPQLEIGEIKKGDEVTVIATVQLFPEIEVKNYKGLEVTKVASEVTDADVDADLKRIQQSQARLETVEGRKTQDGDTVVIDFDGSIDGKHFDGGNAENFELKLGSGQFIPGFEEQLIGKDAGETVDVKVTFPENYNAKDLAGKDALFETKIHEIKVEVLPEIDDDLASDVSEFETLAELKADVKKNLEKNARDGDETQMKNELLDKLCETNEVDVPASMVEDEIDRMLNEMNQQLAYQGMSLDQYMQILGQTMKDVREGARVDANKRVAMRILIRAVVAKEGIEATEAELEDELRKFAEQYGQTVEQVKKVMGEDNMKFFAEDVKTRKAIDFMFDNAKLVEKKEEKAEEESK